MVSGTELLLEFNLCSSEAFQFLRTDLTDSSQPFTAKMSEKHTKIWRKKKEKDLGPASM